MDSDTTCSTTPFPSDTDTCLNSSESEPPSPFSSSQELDDVALPKTPTIPMINRQTDNDKTPTQTSIFKYRPPIKGRLELSSSLSRRLFITPPAGDNSNLLNDDSDLEESLSHTRPLIHLLSVAVEIKQSESVVLRHLEGQRDWTKQLPKGVLERIFLSYICFLQASLHPLNKPYAVPCATSGPLLLSQICKHWRDTALASPLLWGSLSIGNNQPDISLLNSWLSRSRHIPLSLRLNLSLSQDNAEYVDAVLDLFNRHRRSWQILDLRLDDQLADKLCTMLASSDAGSSVVPIRRVRLGTKSCSAPIISKTLFALERFPSLQEIVYVNSDRNSFLSDTISGSPLWSRLTCIDIGAALTHFECIDFLRQCTSATSITFQNINNFEAEENPLLRATHIFLPYLQHFDIVVSTVDVCGTILTRLTCPSLSTLSIVTASNASKTPANLGAFLTRSACPLRILNIFDWMMDIHTLFTFIRAIATSGAGVGSRKWVETLGIYSTKMPRKSEKFYEALGEEEVSNGSLGIKIDRIDYWSSSNQDGLSFRTRVGWGK
ncbi:hypothetical protein BYT27DRAFT_7254920 [Phlegmacium glaucopus]|nr:hypothetical protein BYT27DRAFT_7254920 [Phlegmacium glaucopus]